MSNGQCAVYDFTQPADGEFGVSREFIQENLPSLCKAWCFQLERSTKSTDKNPDGYLHFQGRLSLHKKEYIAGAATLLKDKGFHMSLSHSSKDTVKGPAFYCMKDQTKVDGPWTEKDYKAPKNKLRTVEKMNAEGLRPWQASLLKELDPVDDRTIHIIYDKPGNIGKSAFVKYCYYHDHARTIPGTMNCAEDMIQFAMSFPFKCYLIDMPRAMSKEKLHGMYTGIETIKNGYLYDKRYHGKQLWIDEPNIAVFTNALPETWWLTADRWRYWTIENLELVVYKPGSKKRKRDGVQEELHQDLQEEVHQEGSVQETQDDVLCNQGQEGSSQEG